MDRVGPGVDTQNAAGGDDTVEFLDAGGGVVGKVDICASKSVGDAGGGDVLGWVSVSVEHGRTSEVSMMGLGLGKGHALRGGNGGLGVVHVERGS